MAKINLNKLSKTRYSAHVKATPEEKLECDKKAFEKIQSRVKVDGFRKGRVPEHIIKNRYAADIEENAVQNLVEMVSEQLIKEVDKDIYKIRKIENLEPQKAGYSFDIVFDLYPDINLGKMKGITLKENIAVIEDSDIEKEVKELMKNFAERNQKAENEPAAKGDLLVVRYEQWADGAPLGEPAEGIQLYLGENLFDEEIEKQILNEQGKKGQEFRISRNVKQQDATDKNIDVIVRIDNIFSIKYPDLTDEFVSKYDATYTSVKELKADLNKVLNGRFHRKNMDQEIGATLEKLNEIAEIEFPENYIAEKMQKYLEENHIVLDNFPEKEREEFKTIFEREHKKRIINEYVLREAMTDIKTDDYRSNFLKFVEDNFDSRTVRTFKVLYEEAMKNKENHYSNQLIERLLQMYHLNILEEYFRGKGMIKKDKKIKFSEYFQEKDNS